MVKVSRDSDNTGANITCPGHSANTSSSRRDITLRARDLIAQSILMHPSLFAEMLETAAKTHRDYATLQINLGDRNRVARIAQGLADSCLQAAAFVRDDDITAIMNDLASASSCVVIAKRLQCLPPGTEVDWA